MFLNTLFTEKPLLQLNLHLWPSLSLYVPWPRFLVLNVCQSMHFYLLLLKPPYNIMATPLQWPEDFRADLAPTHTLYSY